MICVTVLAIFELWILLWIFENRGFQLHKSFREGKLQLH